MSRAMRAHYRSTAAALKAALAHAPLHGGASSLGGLHRGANDDESLAPDEACVQAGFIRRRLDQLPSLQRALLVVSYAPRNLSCHCRRPCCSGHYANPEWARALDVVVAHTAPLLAAHRPDIRLRSAIVGNLLTRTTETQVSLAQRCGVSRPTVVTHSAILTEALLGTRKQGGALDYAFERVDALLREAGIVVEPAAEAA
jgi:hypothetical protein